MATVPAPVKDGKCLLEGLQGTWRELLPHTFPDSIPPERSKYHSLQMVFTTSPHSLGKHQGAKCVSMPSYLWDMKQVWRSQNILVLWGRSCDSCSPVWPIISWLEAQFCVCIVLMHWMFLLVIKLVLFGGTETRSDSAAQVTLEVMVILLPQPSQGFQTLKKTWERKVRRWGRDGKEGSGGRGPTEGKRHREEKMTVGEEIG